MLFETAFLVVNVLYRFAVFVCLASSTSELPHTAPTLPARRGLEPKFSVHLFENEMENL